MKATTNWFNRHHIKITQTGTEIVVMGGALLYGLAYLGSTSLTRPLWTTIMVILGSYLVIDYLVDRFLRFEGKGSEIQAFIPLTANKRWDISPAKAYLFFAVLILATAILADLMAEGVNRIDVVFSPTFTAILWSLVVTYFLNQKLWSVYKEKVTRTTQEPP